MSETAAKNVQVIERAEAPAIAPAATESSALISMIDRAARDPNVDIDKMQRLMDMHEKIMAQRAEHAFNQSMALAQSEMEPVRKDANNPQTRSKYASYDALDRAIRPIYTRHGFALSFDTEDSPKAEHVRVVCYVTHSATDRSHTRKYHRDMPADGKGAKGGDVMTKTHAAGSAESYGRRYILQGAFNIATTSRDDDGNAASAAAETVSDEQVDALSKALTDTKSNLTLFLKTIKLESLTQIRADKFDDAMKLIKDTAAKRAAREGTAS